MQTGGKRIKSVSYAKYGYIFSIPFILTFLFFSLYPTMFTAVIGFTDFKGVTHPPRSTTCKTRSPTSRTC